MEEKAEYETEYLNDPNSIFDWNPRMTEREAPPQFEWLPVGIYNGVDLPDTEVDQDYVVWLKMLNPECECEVIVS